ncbi:endonuclease [Aestuariibaculum suncheonense]|uniref:Endonuclease n=1 Tax=Aestuariibaculum suncheonense TaxID=1028745 RepID=A0A8J6UAQ0_9FLAO|nr:endonuclease [Aestuariibaculum suncheonense]MBD0834647.1 endonuclease [Aestuariibaculum suncheonense]
MKQLYLLFFFLLSTFTFSQQAYYNSIDFNQTGLNLKQDLANLITTTHTNELSYGWDAIQATDINPNNTSNVLLIYGWENGTDGNCTNDLERDINSNGGLSCEYNREHVYAKSLATPSMDNTGPGADGHHIRASDVQRNNVRDNQKYASGSGNSGNVTGGWYPGDDWKGDVARVIMYMYLRYGDQCLPSGVGVGSNASTPDDMIDLFLQWNAEDEVSNYEIQRNTYHENTSNTYAQGNRNPFIDNPALATAIWGGPEATDTWGNILGAENFLEHNLKIYPNPVKDYFIYISTTQDLDAIIYNILGKEILKQHLNANNKKIDVSALNKGVYLLKISSDSGTITKKLIKQ